MTIVSPHLRRPLSARERLYTEADLAAMPSELPSGPVRYELDNGRLISMTPPGDQHGAVESNLVTELKVQGERAGFGRVRCGESGVVLWRNPDRVVGVDTLFVSNASLPLRRSEQGYLETIPELVVEVISKNDRRTYIERKVGDYLTAGVTVVWVADPKTRTIVEHRPDAAPRTFTEAEDLTVEDLIPGFRVRVADVFAE